MRMIVVWCVIAGQARLDTPYVGCVEVHSVNRRRTIGDYVVWCVIAGQARLDSTLPKPASRAGQQHRPARLAGPTHDVVDDAMAGFNVLKHTHIMIGLPFLEWHDFLVPPGVPTPPKGGHFCIAPLELGPWGILTGKRNDEGGKTVETATSYGMSVGTDIGHLIPHYNVIPIAPPNLLLPIIIVFSGSKSHFGASTVRFANDNGAPAAFACAVVVNFNLNCAGPTMPALPSGLVIAMPQTVEVGVTVGDLVAGVASLVIDGLLQFAVNRLFNMPGLNALFGRITNRIAPAVLKNFMKWPAMVLGARLMPLIGERAGIWVAQAGAIFMKELVGNVINILVGDPLGYNPDWAPLGGNEYPYQPLYWTDKGISGAQEAIDKHYTDAGESPFIGQ